MHACMPVLGTQVEALKRAGAESADSESESPDSPDSESAAGGGKQCYVVVA